MNQATRRPIATAAATPRRPVAEARTVADVAASRARWLGRLLSLVSLLSLAVMVAATVTMIRDWRLATPIRHVDITGGLDQVSRPDLQAALDRTVRGDFFTANLADVQATALRFPWVASASVSRQWPDRLRVTIEEKQAVARWGDDGLVSRQGEVFRPRLAHGTERLPVLAGPRAQARYVLEQYQAMDSVLRRVGLRIDALQLTERMSWVLDLEGGVRVLVDAQDTLAKLERFTVLYDRQLASDVGSIASIDLRYRNGVAIGWRHG